MFKKFKKLFILIYLLFIVILSIIDKETVFEIIIDTLSLWLHKVFPPIFIFYIISSLLISTRTINIIFFILKPLRKLLRFETDNAFKLFFLSVLIGNPSSSSFIISYLENGLITNNDAKVLNCSASFITPLFIFSLVELKIAIIIYLSHILANFIICIFLTRNNTIKKDPNKPTLINFFTYIDKLPKILLTIAIMMVICNIIIYSLTKFSLNPLYFSFIELSTGSFMLLKIKSSIKYYLLTILISFNGLCIHLQVYSIIKDRLNYLSFFKYRIIQGIISVILFLLIYTHFT